MFLSSRSRRVRVARVPAFAACLALALVGADRPASGQDGPPPGLAAIAATLPPLERSADGIAFPLAVDGPLAWRPARQGVTVTAAAPGGIAVGYTVVSNTPAGAALLVRPGSLAGLSTLTLAVRGERNGQLVVTLRDGAGVTYAFPAIPVRPGGAREHVLDVADLSYLAPASEAPDPGSFEPADAVLVTLLDLAGFMGGEEVATGFVVEGLRGSLGATRAVAAPASTTAAATKALEATPIKALEATPIKAPEAPPIKAAVAPATESRPRHPSALVAERRFFAVFTAGASRDPAAPLRELMIAWLADPRDGRTALLLGLNHLWLAAEGDRTNPRVIEHLLLSERFLASAQELDPSDRRIPSWLVPVRLTLAEFNRRPDVRAALEAELLAAYAEDPNFHSFSVALLGFDDAPDSPAFRRGLEALRGADGDAGCATPGDDPTCGNHPNWPHNVEAFETFIADYELKAGHVAAARARLERVETWPTYAAWPLRGEVVDRLANLELYAGLYADDDRGNDPPSLVTAGNAMCTSCHRTTAAPAARTSAAPSEPGSSTATALVAAH